MTEEIIVDGVNVAGCCCIENGFCLWIKKYYETGITPKCEQVKDCYFKQLKHLEQENKDLKEDIKRKIHLDQMMREKMYEMRQTYRSALEEIRDYLYTLTTVDSDFVNTETYMRINDKIDEVLDA